ncbi:hypothetical protein O181_010091 [Austropuccinia psidii MF-1]|uniref:FAR1 domain-containing protein n=1 Tax=Austropuccinia psidii MF-1 TaxID=1389203 RepID=A0A9Q3BT36_9BASI|nr:hypothetical protein [Austropuccinia psidii MF-1]
MILNQIEIVFYRSGTSNSNKTSSKTVTSRKLDCPFSLYSIKYAKSTTWTLKVKNPEHSHDATENIMEHPSFRKSNEKKNPKLLKCLNPCSSQGKFRPNHAARGSMTGL